MQGTQYAHRESILCLEHFVALQSILQYDLLLTCIKLPSVFETFVLPTFVWPFIDKVCVHHRKQRFYLVAVT